MCLQVHPARSCSPPGRTKGPTPLVILRVLRYFEWGGGQGSDQVSELWCLLVLWASLISRGLPGLVCSPTTQPHGLTPGSHPSTELGWLRGPPSRSELIEGQSRQGCPRFYAQICFQGLALPSETPCLGLVDFSGPGVLRSSGLVVPRGSSVQPAKQEESGGLA